MPNKHLELVDDVLEFYARDSETAVTVSDWTRMIIAGTLKVNGTPLSEFDWKLSDGTDIRTFPNVAPENYREETDTKIKQFIEAEILKNCTFEADKKAEVMNYLMKNLHQGGLLRMFVLSASHMLPQKTAGMMTLSDFKVADMNFMSTASGFSIQESGSFAKVSVMDPIKGIQVHEARDGVLKVTNSKITIDFAKPDLNFGPNEPTIIHRTCQMECANDAVSDKLTQLGVVKEVPKWQRFHTDNSPVNVDTSKNDVMAPNEFVVAWREAVESNKIYVDGNRITMQDGDFTTDEGIKFFFETVLMKNYIGDNKPQALENLMAHFGKAGALSPVRTGIDDLMHERFAVTTKELTASQKDLYAKYNINKPAASNIGMHSRLDLVSTSMGLDIQEKVQVTHIGINHAGNSRQLMPKEGKNHVMKCQAAMKLELSSSQPSLKVDVNTISYGNDDVAQEIDTRRVLQKAHDMIARVFGYRQISNISAVANENVTTVNDDQQVTPSIRR